MEIHHRDTGRGVVVITVAGRIMLGEESAKVEGKVAELMGQGHKNFVFDLSGVTHIDSTGIGRFIASYNRLAQAGGKIRMAAASGVVREAFRVTRLDSVFHFFPDVESACAGL
jgi:stage II sporulation protein AA (anti-sigma F factor antagonist)